MITIAEGVSYYCLCAQAEGKSPKTIRWITQSASYFSAFLGESKQCIEDIKGAVKAIPAPSP